MQGRPGWTVRWWNRLFGRTAPAPLTGEALHETQRETQRDALLAAVERWAANRELALSLAGADRLLDALALIEGDVAEMRAMPGGGDTRPLDLALGMQGQLLFQAGQAGRALPVLAEVYGRCERAGDAEGEEVYARACADACRYLDLGAEAAAWSLRRATALERSGHGPVAARLRDRAARFPEGEPLLRVVLRSRDLPEATWELDELPQLERQATYEAVFTRGRPTLVTAQREAARGGVLGAQEDHEGALRRFDAGAAADPLDPHCRYLASFTLFLLGRTEEAIARAEEVETLAPGWFDNRAWLALSRRLVVEAAPGLVRTLHRLDDGALDPRQAARLAVTALEAHPGVPQLHLLLGKALVRLDRKPEAASAFRAGIDAAEGDSHTRSLLAVQLGLIDPDLARRRELLGRVVHDPDASLLANAFAHVLLAQAHEVT